MNGRPSGQSGCRGLLWGLALDLAKALGVSPPELTDMPSVAGRGQELGRRPPGRLEG